MVQSVHVFPHDVAWSIGSQVSGSASQFPYPGSHAMTWHVPVEHVSLAFAMSHAMLQPPQSVNVCVSRQSRPALASQSA